MREVSAVAVVIKLESGSEEDVALLENADPDDLGEFELVPVGADAAAEQETKTE